MVKQGGHMELIYYEATKKDIDELVRLRIDYIIADFGSISDHEIKCLEQQLPDYFARKLGNELIAFIAKDQNEIAAVAFLHIIEMPANSLLLSGIYGEVLNVYTKPKYRGNGLCTQLIKNLISYGEKKGLGRIDLSATEEGYPIYKKFKSSGNIIVDQVGQMGITGNVVNPNWNYYVTNESGKTNYLAVQILAEIVYWYRPSIKENKTTGIPEFEKKFKHEKYLQRSYYQLEENYNCSKKQAQDALKILFRIGVVIQHLTDGIHGGNVMYLELVPDVLRKISTDVTEKRSHRNTVSKNVPSNKIDITPLQKYDEVDTNLLLPNDENVTTYSDINIENKEENNTETTTVTKSTPARNVHTPTTDLYTVDCGCDHLFELTKELFIKYNLNDKDISDIINVAQSDFNKITKAHKVLVNYKKPIKSVMGFLRNAIINNWSPDDKESHADNSFNEYLRRNGLKSEEDLYSALYVS